jgi:H+/Cl- antiporter ClcA
MSTGSGIPQVRGVIIGKLRYSWLGVLVVKFIDGVLSLFGGLSLGREGPSIQMGACVASGVGERVAKSRAENNVLIAAGASAGLSAAFGAPLAAVIFAFEELFRYLSPITLLATIISAVVSDFVCGLIIGTAPVFNFDVSTMLSLSHYWLLLVLGAICGLAGAGYNIGLLWTQNMYEKLCNRFKHFSLVPCFLIAIPVAFLLPVTLGSGHQVLDVLTPEAGIGYLLVLLVVKYIWSTLSFSSGCPGGIFFPLLILGAAIGSVFSACAIQLGIIDPSLFYNFVILSMSAMFAAIVRAPITGIILLTEMTGNYAHLLPLTLVSVIAYFVADAVKVKPIYDSLLERMTAGKTSAYAGTNARITTGLVVHQGAAAAGKRIEEIGLAPGMLIISIRRGEQDVLAQPTTQVEVGDYLTVLMDRSTETAAREHLAKLFSAR